MIWLDDPKWMDWAIRDPEHDFAIIGVKEDAPQWVKEIWEKHLRALKQIAE